MKRLITLSLILIIGTTTANAQYVSVTYSGYSANQREIRKDVKELRDFEYQLDRFSYLLMVDDLRKARFVKQLIIKDMEREIRQTRSKLRAMERSLNVTHYRRERAQVYSKRNGQRNRGDSFYELQILEERLQHQMIVKEEFEYTRLRTRNRGKISANRHRSLMYEFRDTMRDEIKEARDDNRIVPRQRYRRG
jgi:hypothetical protein